MRHQVETKGLTEYYVAHAMQVHFIALSCYTAGQFSRASQSQTFATGKKLNMVFHPLSEPQCFCIDELLNCCGPIPRRLHDPFSTVLCVIKFQMLTTTVPKVHRPRVHGLSG